MTAAIISWTYTGKPALSDRDAVRFLIGDTDPADKKIGDAEIEWAVSEEANVYYAAAACARAIAAHYGARPQSKTVGDLSITWGEIKQQYLTLAANLEARGAMKCGGIHVTGLTQAEVDSEKANTSRVKRSFSVDMMTRDNDEGSDP